MPVPEDPAVGTVPSAEERDPRLPPRWLPRALAMTVAAVIAGILVWQAASKLSNVMTILIIAWFVALAMEPMILWLVRRGLRRSAATGLTMLVSMVVGIGILALLGGLFVNQLVDLVQSIPGYYADLRSFMSDQFNIELPPPTSC